MEGKAKEKAQYLFFKFLGDVDSEPSELKRKIIVSTAIQNASKCAREVINTLYDINGNYDTQIDFWEMVYKEIFKIGN
ncbi:hypothetical protein HZQ14_15810 [Elizabethkingia anophelis]|nr:hypothetical protein [Elizabethkingia anophelis]